MMKMIDQGENDEKIICVNIDDAEYRHYTNIDQLPPHRLAELRGFFEDYKRLERKEVKVEDFTGPESAMITVEESIKKYNQKYGGRHGQSYGHTNE
jgi:inorganic pyrophosphatase